MTSVAARETQLWADKYRPQSLAQMCYPTCANKLKAWLESFQPAGVGDGRRPRGALLSGPPGVGKTTSVYVVARELGRSVIEYNASDFRSRKSLHEKVSDLVDNTAFSRRATSYTNAVLLMDEVDGCDIGGVGEVIEMLKTTQVPIVCTCNDRWNPKLRSLLNYVEDIRFSRPPCNIVANYLCDHVLAREGVALSKPLLQDIIKRSGSDIRNMLNNLQLWCLNKTSLEQRQLAQCAVQSTKNGDVGLFDAAEYFLLQGTTHGERHSLVDMQATYYNADLLDMFVQENYLHYNPSSVDGRDWMTSVAQAATCISRGDAIQRMMYNEQNWTASRAYVLLSSIAPCVYTRGRYESFCTGQQVFFDRQRPVKFPSWLGNNSTANKNRRLLRILAMQASHPTHGVSATQEDVATDYIPLGWELKLTRPLQLRQKDGIAEVIAAMDDYHLLRDDWDFVQGNAHYKHMSSPSLLTRGAAGEIATATKSAFTREFNRTHQMESLAKVALVHTSETNNTNTATNDASEEGSSTSEEDDDEGSGAIAKARKVKAAQAAAAAAAAVGQKAKTTKGRAAARKATSTTTATRGKQAKSTTTGSPARKKATATAAAAKKKLADKRKAAPKGKRSGGGTKRRRRSESDEEEEDEVESSSSSSSSSEETFVVSDSDSD